MERRTLWAAICAAAYANLAATVLLAPPHTLPVFPSSKPHRESGVTLRGAPARIAHPGRAPFGQVASAEATDMTAIQHIVFIVKENRSFDNYFGTFPGADGATTAVISTGQVIPLGHTPDALPRDLDHSWGYAITAMDSGKMDRFDVTYTSSYPCNVNGDYLCLTQLTQQDIPNYFTYAQNFVLADQMFSSLQGSSFPNHLYTVAAQSGGAVNNPTTVIWGCDAPAGASVSVINSQGNLSSQFPCFDFQTLADSLSNVQPVGLSHGSQPSIRGYW